MFKDRETYFEIDDLKKFGVKAVYTTKKIGDIDILLKIVKMEVKIFLSALEKKMHKLSMQDRLIQQRLLI